MTKRTVATKVHAYDYASPEPSYPCGRWPVQRAGGTAAIYVYSRRGPSARRALRHVTCKDCRRVLLSRLTTPKRARKR